MHPQTEKIIKHFMRKRHQPKPSEEERLFQDLKTKWETGAFFATMDNQSLKVWQTMSKDLKEGRPKAPKGKGNFIHIISRIINQLQHDSVTSITFHFKFGYDTTLPNQGHPKTIIEPFLTKLVETLKKVRYKWRTQEANAPNN